jgi:hypothetical protein
MEVVVEGLWSRGAGVMREGLEEGLEVGKQCSVGWRIEDGGRR